MFEGSSNQIKAIVYRKTTGNMLKEVYEKTLKSTTIEFDYKDFTYVVDLESVIKFDKKGRPIVEYELEHISPLKQMREDETPKSDGDIVKIYNEGKIKSIKYKIELGKNDSSTVFKKLFGNKLLLTILEASQKAKEAIPVWMGIGAGIGMGLAVGLMLFPYVFPQMIVVPEIILP